MFKFSFLTCLKLKIYKIKILNYLQFITHKPKKKILKYNPNSEGKKNVCIKYSIELKN